MNAPQHTLKYLVLLGLFGLLILPGKSPAEPLRNPLSALKPLPKTKAAPRAQKKTRQWDIRPQAGQEAGAASAATPAGEDPNTASGEEPEFRLRTLNREPGPSYPVPRRTSGSTRVKPGNPVSLDRPALDRLALSLKDITTMPLEVSPDQGFSGVSGPNFNVPAETQPRSFLTDRNSRGPFTNPTAMDRKRAELPRAAEANLDPAAAPVFFPQTRQLMDQIGTTVNPSASPFGSSRPLSNPGPTPTGGLLQPAISTLAPETRPGPPATTRPPREPRRMRSRIGDSQFRFKKSTEF